MSTTAVTKSEPAAAPAFALRPLPKIDPGMVKVDHRGLARTSYLVRLPEGMIVDDLKEPRTWSRVQKTAANSLKQHDALYLVSFDQAWVVEAIVSEADALGATLAGVRVIQTPQRARLLFRDDKYGIKWNGAGYYVERLSDGQKMTGQVANPALAERDLRNLYPKPV